MKIGLLLIGKKGVWNPNFLQVLRPDRQFVQTPTVGEGQPGVGPVLAEIKVESKVLKIGGKTKASVSEGSREVGFFSCCLFLSEKKEA